MLEREHQDSKDHLSVHQSYSQRNEENIVQKLWEANSQLYIATNQYTPKLSCLKQQYLLSDTVIGIQEFGSISVE